MLSTQIYGLSYLQQPNSVEILLKKNREIVESAKQTLLKTQQLIARASNNREFSHSNNDVETDKFVSFEKYHDKYHDKRKITSEDEISRNKASSESIELSSVSITHAHSYVKYREIEPDQSKDNDIEIRIGEVFSKKDLNSTDLNEYTSKLGEISSDGKNREKECYLRNKIYKSLYQHEVLREKKNDFIYEIKSSLTPKPTYQVYQSSVLKQRTNEYIESTMPKMKRPCYIYHDHAHAPKYPPPNVNLFPEPPDKNVLLTENISQQWNESETERQSPKQVVKNNKTGYLCNVCGKVYCRKYVLKIHQRVHSGEKPLQCRVCGKCFSDPSNMKKHVKLHDADNETYSCRFCGRHFIRRRGLVNHIQSVHSKEISYDYDKHNEEVQATN